MKILIAKPGLDGHDRGAILVTQYLRDQGHDVIYTGIRQTPEQIVATARDEDVDIIGISCLSGAHLELTADVVGLLKKGAGKSFKLIIGGIIPETDIQPLKDLGVSEVFTPGTPLDELGRRVSDLCPD